MITVKLRGAMEDYWARSGERLTYAKLAGLTGISESTLRKVGSSLSYHPTLANIEKLCRALGAGPGDLLELIDDPPKRKRARRSKKKTKKS